MNYNLRKEAEWQKSVRDTVDNRRVREYNEKEDAVVLIHITSWRDDNG